MQALSINTSMSENSYLELVFTENKYFEDGVKHV